LKRGREEAMRGVPEMVELSKGERWIWIKVNQI